jgi:hypothetical protein
MLLPTSAGESQTRRTVALTKTPSFGDFRRTALKIHLPLRWPIRQEPLGEIAA